MTGNATCVDIYQQIRSGVRADAMRISVGRNLFPASEVVSDHVSHLHTVLIASGRLTDYVTQSDNHEKSLIARLINEYLRREIYNGEDVFLTNGSQEAISILCQFGAAKGMSAQLPLPVYYSFEQSSIHHGMPIASYYSFDGRIHLVEENTPHLFRVILLPNPVTGTFFAIPEVSAHKCFTVIDCVFQLGHYEDPGLIAACTRDVIDAVDIENTALTFTVSKDLSLPGLRVGAFISKNRDLIRMAKEGRFERNYSISPMVGLVMAMYFGLLIINDRRISPTTALATVSVEFDKCDLPFPTASDLQRIMDHVDAMTARCAGNLYSIIDYCDFLDFEDELVANAGYSALPKVSARFDGSRQFLRWIHDVGTQLQLKVNPDVMFGGDAAAWEFLYSSGRRIRVNTSERPEVLTKGLARLAEGFERYLPTGAT